MDYSEKDIESTIFEDELLTPYGINCLRWQYPTAYGIIDILGYSPGEKRFIIIELKKGVVEESAIGQIMRYMTTIKEIQDQLIKEYEDLEDVKRLNVPRGILIGAGISEGAASIVRNFSYLQYLQTHIYMHVDLCSAPIRVNNEALLKDMTRFMESSILDEISYIAIPDDIDDPVSGSLAGETPAESDLQAIQEEEITEV